MGIAILKGSDTDEWMEATYNKHQGFRRALDATTVTGMVFLQ